MSDQIETIRPNTIYITWQTKKSLDYIAKCRTDQTRDELAESILASWIHERFPEVVEHLKESRNRDKEFQEKLYAKIKNAPF